MRKCIGVALGAALGLAFACGSAIAQSAYLGDYATGTVVCRTFATYQPSTGAAFALASGAVDVYFDNSDTQDTDDSGLTLTASVDSVAGLNRICVDTSTDGTFYAAGRLFHVVLTAGTVDSVSVAGSTILEFSLQKTAALRPTTAGRSLDVSAGGEAGVDWANVGAPTTTVNLSGTTIATSQAVASVSGAVGSIGTGGISEASFATTTGSIDALGISRQGTAQSASSTTVTLDGSAPFGDNTTIGSTIALKGSTNGNYWQSCLISSYVASTKVATISCPSGFVTPTGTIIYKQWSTAVASGGGAGLDAAGVRAAIGLATANLDTQLAGIQSDTDNVQTRLPTSLVSGRIDASVGAYQTGLAPLQPSIAGRTLDVSATGEGGIDWANVGTPGASVTLTNTTISTTQGIASVSGNVGGNVTGSIGSLATQAKADVNAEADTALADIFLNRLFAVDYDPANKPGAAGAWGNEIVENDGGAIRFTTQVLENGPAGGGGGSSDWSVGEKEQIRHRLGIDGTATAPATGVPSLASAATVAGLPSQITTQVRDSVSEDQGAISRGCVEAVLLAYAAGDFVTSGSTTTYKDPSNGEVRIVGTVSGGTRNVSITCPSY